MNCKLILVDKKDKVLDTVEVNQSVIANIINGDISTTIETSKKTFEISSVNNYEVSSVGKELVETLTLEVVEDDN